MSAPEPPASSPRVRPGWLPWAAGAALVAVAVALVLVLRGGGDSPSAAAPGTTGPAPKPTAATRDSLAELSGSVKHPVFWAGAQSGQTLELTRTPDGAIYVRYLPPGVALGDPRPDFLTVGTYPQAAAFKAVTQAAKRAGAQVLELPEGGMAVASRSRPKSWYLAYPGTEQLVEVYSPRVGGARSIVRSGDVAPVKG